MVQLVVFVNLFFIPLLPLYAIYRKRQKPLEPNLDLLFQYGIVAACNIPLTKVFISLIKTITGKAVSIDSGYYTVAAFLPTFSVIFAILLYRFYKIYPDHEPWKEKIIQKGIKGIWRDLIPAYILLFAYCFMLFLFEPILMYVTNMNDFWFDFQVMIWPVLMIFGGAFLIGAVIIFAVYSADLLISKRLLLYKGSTLIGFIIFFLTYLQGNWLAGNLPVLDGEKIEWELYGKLETFVLISAAVILSIAIIASIRKRGLNRTVFYSASCASVVFVMLFASLVPTMAANRAFENRDVFSPTLKNFNTVSSNKNFLIFLVDFTDSRTFYNIMMEDDDFQGMMDDFTYYPDTMSVYPQTRDSIPNILTGTVYRCEMDFPDYCSIVYNQSPFFEKLTQNGYEINLYTHTNFEWPGEKNYNIENTTSIYDSSVDLVVFARQELKYIMFKYFPYGLKQLSRIDTLDFDTCRIENSEYDAYTWKNKVNYRRLTENSVLDKQSNNYFQFIHIEGSHEPPNMDKYLNSVEDGTYEQKVGASLTMIKTYLQRLKDNDAYDNSVIVVMADHGAYDPYVTDAPYITLSKCNPILFIKGINEKHGMLTSDRSVSYVDLQDAFSDLIDGKQSTEIFAGLEPGRTRTAFFQYTKTVYHKVEYKTTGKAWEVYRYTPTGNVYDLHASKR